MNTAEQIFQKFRTTGEPISWFNPERPDLRISQLPVLARVEMRAHRRMDPESISLSTAYPAAEFGKIKDLKSPEQLRERLRQLGIYLPVDDHIQHAKEGGDLARPVRFGRYTAQNSLCVQPMEGCNAHRDEAGYIDGSPSEMTFRSWIMYGLGGAGMIWGGEAAAVVPEGRANPRQTLATITNEAGIRQLAAVCLHAHAQVYGMQSCEGLVMGLQLTHSGRNCRPDDQNKRPLVMYSHPVYDPQNTGYILTDSELDVIVEAYVESAKMAERAGFHFVDIKACHGYLLHESLSAFTRIGGKYGGDNLEDRARLLLTIIDRVKEACPNLEIGVRLSAFDTIPDRFLDPVTGTPKSEFIAQHMEGGHYNYAFGVDHQDPMKIDFRETLQLAKMLQEHGVAAINITAGNPYETPGIQRPTPQNMFRVPSRFDPLLNSYNLLTVSRLVKEAVPGLTVVSSGLSVFEQFMPNVMQGLIREGWCDSAAYGRRVLADPFFAQRILNDGNNEVNLIPSDAGAICRNLLHCVVGMRADATGGAGCFPFKKPFKGSDGQREVLDWIKKHRPQ